MGVINNILNKRWSSGTFRSTDRDYLENVLVYQYQHDQTDRSAIPITPRKFKASSNSKCPCNSGKKFKLCCKVK